MHLDRFGTVVEGDVVQAGDVLGYLGNTGNARGTPSHLHYGIYRNGPKNPYYSTHCGAGAPPLCSSNSSKGESAVADKYPNFAALARNERSGIDYHVLVRRARPAFAIVAPHGGGIEPGTSEIADAIAGEKFSFYTFEGLKSSGNADLHITSTRFDEPMCLTVLGHSTVVVTLHGEHSEDDGEGVFIGGLDTALGARIGTTLTRRGFDVRKHEDPDLQGREPKNICNRGTSRAGVQLELSRAVRKTMFESLTRAGRKRPTARFDVFVSAVSRVLGS